MRHWSRRRRKRRGGRRRKASRIMSKDGVELWLTWDFDTPNFVFV
jgi:hypothetical protein